MSNEGKVCRECGGAMKNGKGKPMKALALFCSGECRQAFNRRRRDRGAELYDFVMQAENSQVEKLKGAYQSADKVKRAGRPSWQPLTAAAVALPVVFGADGDGR
jgi:hypothetical protein